MKVLLLGSGGREHAIAWAVSRSPRLTKLWTAPGSDAMAELSERVDLDILDGAAVARFARDKRVDLLLIGPEAPLAAGVADAARAAGVAVFGPSRKAARLESSKSFAKDFMTRHGVPTARARSFLSAASAKIAARVLGGRCAVKADGLASGKGVVVCRTAAEADAAADLIAKTAAGNVIVVEELLEGPEVTLMCLTDGRSCSLLPPSQDHKRLLDGDKGPNTGGMGALAPVLLPEETSERIKKEIVAPTLAGLKKDGLEYVGALYIGVMLTRDGPKVLEYNARFGDPETQAVLPLLAADFLTLAADCAEGKTPGGSIRCKPGACVAVTLASPGYPDKPEPGASFDLAGIERLPDVLLFHAGTRRDGERWVATGGRVLTVVGLGPDLAAARERAYGAAARLEASGLHFRRDIAAASGRAAA